MDLWSIDRLTLFFLFFLPGFVSLKVYDLLVPGETRDFSRAFFDALSYSALNFVILLPVASSILSSSFLQRHRPFGAITLIVILLLAALLWPIGYVRLTSWRPVASRIVHPIRKPWDYVFGKRQSFWIIVHLKDGRRVGGKFDADSFASSSPAEEQIYLEEVWALDDASNFEAPIPRSKGIIVMRTEIAAIEFFE